MSRLMMKAHLWLTSPPSQSPAVSLLWQRSALHRLLGRCLSSAGGAATTPTDAAAAATTAAPVRLPRVYEPAYLDHRPDYPAMDLFHLSLTSHEYPTLERFAKYAQSLVRHQFGIDQCEHIAWPQRRTSVDLYQQESTKVRDSFLLATYRRVIAIDGLPAAEAGLLINLLGQNLPEGVTMTVQRPTEDDTEFRYVPDLEIQVLKKQVEMGRSGGKAK